jgi:hypothetical protein
MLFGLGLFFAACGVGMGLAGFLGWTVRVGLGMLK